MASDSTSASRAPARPSSSTSEDPFAGLYARGAVAAAVDGRAWWQAMLDVEAALARACARTGEIAPGAAAAAAAAAGLAERFRATPIMARTILRPVLPTSFGLKAAGWLTGIEEGIGALVTVREERLAVQMGGPVGHRDQAVAAHVAAELRLGAPLLPWAGDRARPAALAAALGLLAGALAKVARDVVLLAQGEVAEVREGGPGGGSSAMAHERNPAAAFSVLACARRVPGLVATVLGAMAQEHERAAGGWQAEWGTITNALVLTGSAAAWGREPLERLEVDEARMRDHVTGPSDLGASEALVDRALDAHRAAAR